MKRQIKAKKSYPRMRFCPACGKNHLAEERWTTRDAGLKFTYCLECGTHFGVCQRVTWE